MIVGVIGSREFPLLDLVVEYIDRIARKYPNARIISGGARGVDRAAEEHAASRSLEVVSYRPLEVPGDELMSGINAFTIETVTVPENLSCGRRINPPFFKTWAKAAYARNGWIVDDSTVVVAFHDGTSTGTANGIELAQRADKLAAVIPA